MAYRDSFTFTFGYNMMLDMLQWLVGLYKENTTEEHAVCSINKPNICISWYISVPLRFIVSVVEQT
jgi:hypothetical protein